MDWPHLLAYIIGRVDQELLLRNEYLAAENRILRAKITGRLQLSDGEKSTLGEIGRPLGRKALAEVAVIARPDTILRWFRKLVASKFDGSPFRQTVGRARVDPAIENLIVRMARENPAWGYDRMVGASSKPFRCLSWHRVELSALVIEYGRIKTRRSRPTITCEVIAASRDLLDIGFVAVQNCHNATEKQRRIIMQNYPIHTVASAPESSKSALEQLQQAFGVIPNLAAAIANSPKLINSLVGVFQQVHSSSLNEQEIQIVLLTDAVANSSTYAVAFHTALALQQGVTSKETDAIRQRRVPANQRFAALSSLANTLIEKRGHLSDQELDSFLAAGFTKEQVLEVIAIVAASTITNYAGTLANPPLEDPFRQYAWRA